MNVLLEEPSGDVFDLLQRAVQPLAPANEIDRDPFAPARRCCLSAHAGLWNQYVAHAVGHFLRRHECSRLADAFAFFVLSFNRGGPGGLPDSGMRSLSEESFQWGASVYASARVTRWIYRQQHMPQLALPHDPWIHSVAHAIHFQHSRLGSFFPIPRSKP